jgi:hypothetical protein
MLLLDWDTNQVDPAKIEDWQLSASTFFASFWAKAVALGLQHVPRSTKDEIRAYCRQLCANEQVRQLLHWMLSGSFPHTHTHAHHRTRTHRLIGFVNQRIEKAWLRCLACRRGRTP